MRTRFLTDFFNSSGASQSLHTIDFLRFPPPQLHSSGHLNIHDLSCFDQLNCINVYPEIERFSVDESLSKFLSDVLPQDISTEIDQQVAREVASEEKIKEDDTVNTNLTLVEFEIPELSISLEDSYFLHEEKIQIFFEATDAEFPTGLLDFSLEPQQRMDIHKSLFLVEDICLENQEEHTTDLFKDYSLVKGQTSSDLRPFPLLEVDEISLGINSYVFDDKHVIFESNELQQWTHQVELTCDSTKLLLSTEFDILENLLNHSCLECQKFEAPGVDFGPEYIINAIEYSLIPLELEQPQFFDMNTSHFSQVFSDTRIISEVTCCEQMCASTTLSTFNDLIVTHELVLKDDSFKSLPVPIISDNEQILSVQIIVEELFVKLKLQASSTSDDIYLDWHLLEEDNCSHMKHVPLKIFEDIDTYCINADMNAKNNSGDSSMMVLDFVLSDECFNEQNTKENIEILNLERAGDVMQHVHKDRIDSSEICKKMESGKSVVDNKVNKGYHLVGSMSQFDNLDFFLNPLEATSVKKQKSTGKMIEMDFAPPVASANNPIETHDTSRKPHQRLEDEIHSRGDFHSTSILNERSKILETPLHSTHVEGKNNRLSMEATYEAPQLPLAMESKKVNTNTTSSPNAIIIVNTRNVETSMIISRRTTYQKILSMEKEGVQVIERDLNLPVDAIISAAVCLVLYDSKNIRTDTSSSDGASSLPSCVENIAANVLTSLSFALSSCVMIFEGEVGFLGGIMELSDELYAAAASLGIDLQLFYSYSSDTTDDIILNCITHAAKSTTGLYPKMPESETLAESFLTKFPSLNPLSAHAILASVEKLVDFFKMTHQQRVCALQKYLVPEAGITLFSALCRYGEREDSRSGMTDCCSSVSSGHDSGYCCPKVERKVDHEQKKRKYITSPETKPVPMDHLFQFEKVNDVFWNSEANVAFDARMMLNSSSLTETSFGHGPGYCYPKVDHELMKKKHIMIPETKPVPVDHLFQVGKVNDVFWNSEASTTFDERMMVNRSSLIETCKKGEVIDIDDDDENDVIAEKPSPEWFSLPSFPTSAEINPELDSWIPTKDNGEILSEGFIPNSQAELMNTSLCYARTPLSKAIASDQPQKGSPWTIDFLNRIKEKSRLRHQLMPNISSAPCFDYSRNSSKGRKRKSPSILDFYRYTGSKVNSVEPKGQKGYIQAPSSSKAVKTKPSSSQTLTPIDKRAKRKLTFATSGNKGQSKLVWGDWQTKL